MRDIQPDVRQAANSAGFRCSFIPSGSSSSPRSVSVAGMGRYEIRMFNSLPTRTGDAPLLWVELFDHDAQISVDSCACREIDDAVSAFDDLVSQVKNSGGLCRPEADDAQV